MEIEPPRTFLVVFPKNAKWQMDFCEKERETIVSNLSELLGETPVLRFTVDTSIQLSTIEREDTSDSSFQGSKSQIDDDGNYFGEGLQNTGETVSDPASSNYSELRRETSVNKVAKQILDVFGAELIDVKTTISPSSEFMGHEDEWL